MPHRVVLSGLDHLRLACLAWDGLHNLVLRHCHFQLEKMLTRAAQRRGSTNEAWVCPNSFVSPFCYHCLWSRVRRSVLQQLAAYICAKLFSQSQPWSRFCLQRSQLTGYIKPIDISSRFRICFGPFRSLAICRLLTPNQQKYDDALQYNDNRPSNPSK